MRLSEVLNRAPNNEALQVENFLGHKRLGWGKQKAIRVGSVFHNFHCLRCNDIRSYQSEPQLMALVAGENLVSLDVALKCPGCSSSVECWFLVKGLDDLHLSNPRVFLVRYTENRRGSVRGLGIGAGQFEELIDQAQIAYENRLGAGSMVYLRKIFELITYQVASTAGISIIQSNGKPRPFKQLLEEVDEQHRIIPRKFSENGYRLFSELSNVIHGEADEDVALRKYFPCRELVLSVVKNVKGDEDVSAALDALGWNAASIDIVTEGEVS